MQKLVVLEILFYLMKKWIFPASEWEKGEIVSFSNFVFSPFYDLFLSGENRENVFIRRSLTLDLQG